MAEAKQMSEQSYRPADQLTRAVTARASVDQINWVVFGAFWGANALLLIALVQSLDIRWVVPIAGLIVSLVWLAVQRRALGHLRYLEEVVEQLEKALGVPPDHAISGWINKAAYDKLMPHPKWLRARDLMVGSGVVAALCWAALLIAKALHWA